MKTVLKKFFLPHEHNNYHPHILHTKRAVFYIALFAVIKVILIIFVLSLPDTVFVLPDVLAPQEEKLVSMANELRASKGLSPLKENIKLGSSALLKSTDMAEGQYFSHTGPNGESLSYYLKKVSYPYAVAGENLAMGYTDSEELFKAWVNSPKHYENLIDDDFEETGIALAAGSYANVPTIYVTEHFGQQKKAVLAETVGVKAEVKPEAVKSVAGEADNTVAEDSANEVVSIDRVSTPEIVEEKNSGDNVKELTLANYASGEKDEQEINIDKEKSYLAWSEDGNGQLKLIARVFISGPVKEAQVEVKNYSIPLITLDADGRYVGEISVEESANDFFKVVFPASIKITTESGEVIEESLPWLSIKVVNPATFEKYALAKKTLGPITGIFEFSKRIYLGFLGLFFASLILAFSFAKEMHKKHPHIIPQTVGLIGLLVLFYII